MPTSLKTFLFDLLPLYFKLEDSNKDKDPLTQDRGTLERFLEIFGLELDAEVLPFIDNFTDTLDPETTDEKFLNDIAFTLGNPPDFENDIARYRKLLSFVMSVYKIKGTKRAYELFFAILGFDVTIIELDPEDCTLYDDSNLYDDDETYDTCCPTCSEYDILFRNRDDDCFIPTINPIDESTLDKLKEIICFNEPINAILRNLINKAAICEDLIMCVSENVKIISRDFDSYDEGLLYDDSKTYDVFVETTPVDQFIVCGTGTPTTPEGVDFWILETDFEVQP